MPVIIGVFRDSVDRGMMLDTRFGQTRRFLLRWLAAGLAAISRLGQERLGAQRPDGRRHFTIRASRYQYQPNRLEVEVGDLVKIELLAEDIPHSFTLEAYRIVKRAKPQASVAFEFLADRPGTFPFYCNLTIDEGCRGMRGQLVVRPR